jgi:Reversibly glycosylated polypeptide
MQYGIVVTTIYGGEFLDEYYQHFQSRGELEQVRFYVIGDLNTPPECRDRVEQYRAMGLNWFYFGKEEQEKFLLPFPELASEIPWKTDNRRNIGFLMAYQDRCDVVIAIDDDNYPKENWPFLEGHQCVGTSVTLPTAVGYNNWFNLCSMMEVNCKSQDVQGTVYARGFPYLRRDPRCSQLGQTPTSGLVAINAGLWSGDPDVDAATRLVTRCEAFETFQDSYLLAPGTLMPINTQNTALIRDAIPAYYYVKMGHPINGMKLDRFGDIFSGFFVQKCAQAVGHSVRVGSPVVDHRRSPHNLYKDLWHELAGMVVIDDMLPLLESPLPSTASYGDAALLLAERIHEWAMDRSGFLWDEALKLYFSNVSKNIELWVSVCRELS